MTSSDKPPATAGAPRPGSMVRHGYLYLLGSLAIVVLLVGLGAVRYYERGPRLVSPGDNDGWNSEFEPPSRAGQIYTEGDVVLCVKGHGRVRVTDITAVSLHGGFRILAWGHYINLGSIFDGGSPGTLQQHGFTPGPFSTDHPCDNPIGKPYEGVLEFGIQYTKTGSGPAWADDFVVHYRSGSHNRSTHTRITFGICGVKGSPPVSGSGDLCNR